MVRVIESAAVDENLLQIRLFGFLDVAESRAQGAPPPLGEGAFFLGFNSSWHWLCWPSLSKKKLNK